MPVCGSPICEGRIRWLVNDKTGNRAPIDPPSEVGNITVDIAAGTYHVLADDEMPSPGKKLHTNHFYTCPDADYYNRCSSCRQSPCIDSDTCKSVRAAKAERRRRKELRDEGRKAQEALF